MKSLPVPRSTLFTVTAFLVTPLVAAFSLALSGAVLTGLLEFKVTDVLLWTFVFYFYAAWATVLLGLPAFLVLRKLGAVRWWSATLVGLVGGILVLAFIDHRGLSVVASEHQGPLLWGGVGALSAFVFWLIWRQGLSQRSSGAANDA